VRSANHGTAPPIDGAQTAPAFEGGVPERGRRGHVPETLAETPLGDLFGDDLQPDDLCEPLRPSSSRYGRPDASSTGHGRRPERRFNQEA